MTGFGTFLSISLIKHEDEFNTQLHTKNLCGNVKVDCYKYDRVSNDVYNLITIYHIGVDRYY